MTFCHQPIIAWPGAAEACFIPAEDSGGWIVAESQAAYRPRHPERTGFYQLCETYFDSYVRAYEERFEPRSGPLRPMVVRSVEAFLSCGRLQGGFARIRCPKCRDEHLFPFAARKSGQTADCRAALSPRAQSFPAIRCLPRLLSQPCSDLILFSLVPQDRKSYRLL